MHIYVLFIYPGLIFSSLTSALLVNVSVDDSDPEQRIIYAPPDGWNNGLTCTDCSAHVDPSQMYQGTWHDSTFNVSHLPTATVRFTGSAVYVFCALARTTASPTGNSNMVFFIDGVQVGSFVKQAPGIPSFDYDIVVYSNTSLSNGMHEITIQNGTPNGTKSLVLLDQIVYSFDNGTLDQRQLSSTNSSSSLSPVPVSVIIGASIGGTGALALFALVIYLYRLGNRKKLTPTPMDHISPFVLESEMRRTRNRSAQSPSVASAGYSQQSPRSKRVKLNSEKSRRKTTSDSGRRFHSQSASQITQSVAPLRNNVLPEYQV